jgi:polyhydroxyalkanoate synthesis regulator protein
MPFHAHLLFFGAKFALDKVWKQSTLYPIHFLQNIWVFTGKQMEANMQKFIVCTFSNFFFHQGSLRFIDF